MPLGLPLRYGAHIQDNCNFLIVMLRERPLTLLSIAKFQKMS